MGSPFLAVFPSADPGKGLRFSACLSRCISCTWRNAARCFGRVVVDLGQDLVIAAVQQERAGHAVAEDRHRPAPVEAPGPYHAIAGKDLDPFGPGVERRPLDMEGLCWSKMTLR
ncbi:hypothetical protein Misp01_53190 [Microtetraspora sp. NBRC 13810]|uniref:hypothetical protein n=1 Tax=Microtetraspora sp. NBRC 13810 TaxID=3030990 RepID=UPI0025540B08|nr:hypothetical protein [Microtetraspora sp. NBRC 13810]GLW10190.1 hypothetical protein Misp01_53190 [Microtetraspora sp. NBRC 13810]